MANRTLRVQYASDLHLEFVDDAKASRVPWERIVEPCAPVLALCGDIGRPGSVALQCFLKWAAAHWEAVVMVAGNHEMHNKQAATHWRSRPHDPPSTPEDFILQLRTDCKEAGPNVRFLERDSLATHGVTFHGCSLWTRIPSAKAYDVASRMSDYSHVAVRAPGDDSQSGVGNPLTVDDVNRWHDRDVTWLRHATATTDGPQCIVTHHVPATDDALTPPECRADSLQCAFSSPDAATRVLETGGDVRAWLCGPRTAWARRPSPAPTASARRLR
jgi:hypothetical protein